MDKNYGYKHTKGFILFILILILGLLSVAYGQTSTTGNLNNGSWANVYSVNSLTCWQAGDPSCSPGTPYLRPDGNINFSYNMTDIYQYHNVKNVLPYSGTGLVVTGWHLQYTAKVGNGWDDGAYDYLRSYVNIVGKGNTLIEQANFVHTGTHDWYTFNLANSYSPLTSRYTTENLTRVGFGFIGRDNNYWVGPYGPEINNVSFTLNYQPDPCLRSQLVSPQCPGFLDAIQNVAAVPKQAEPAVESIATSITLTTNSEVKKIETTAQTVARIRQRDELKLVQAGPEQATETASTESKTTSQVATVTMTEQTRSTQQTRMQTRTAIQTQAEVSVAVDNQQIDQTVVPGTRQAQEQATVSTNLQTTNIIATPNTTTENNSVLLQVPAVIQQIEPTKIEDNLASLQQSNLYRPPSQLQQQNISLENTQNIEQIAIVKPEIQVQEISTALPVNMLTDKTNPINDIVTAQPQIASISTFSGPAVNQKAQDNDAAGGVSITQLARLPAGYEVYNVSLKDVAFYAPKEIYRNQKTIDNVRALRSLASDRLHQQMVEQQYLPR